ncbi:hypothetical protein KIH74_13420 [Kineosporia sp. J2-2]|uniref:Ricin B lectin domain-containing protein n=1 Tax=Kineosporia corallincola TaxID=2835133 RepID=A0ABS5TIB1_9ACTN|nr:hypothetical protein [Kineosporia corallincola]MBT0769931.1 hypothetical protein [Kineosporia corallincola]
MARLRSVAAAGILVTGALVTSACGSDSASASAGRLEPAGSTATTTTTPATSSATGTQDAAETEVEPADDETTTKPADDGDSSSSTLPSSGKGVTIVPADGFEGGLTLEDEGLSMTDDDSGRQLFTFKELANDLYQVKATDSSGELAPLCWRAPDADEIGPSPIVAGQCDADSEKQQFRIYQVGDQGWVISRTGAGNIVLGSNGLEYDDSRSTKWRINS